MRKEKATILQWVAAAFFIGLTASFCDAAGRYRRFRRLDELLGLFSTVRVRTRSGRIQPSQRDELKGQYRHRCIRLSPPTGGARRWERRIVSQTCQTRPLPTG